MPFFEYAAMDPLTNRTILDSGLGAAPMVEAAQAYSVVGEGLRAAATDTDALLETMREAWPGGLSAERARSAFAKHNHWVRDQANHALHASMLAHEGARLHTRALAAMPPRDEIIAVMSVLAASAETMALSGPVAAAGIPGVSLGAALVFSEAAAVHLEAEFVYGMLWDQAAATMIDYELGAGNLLADLVHLANLLTPPPPIVAPGPGAPPPTRLDGVGPLRDLLTQGPDSRFLPGRSSTNENILGNDSLGTENPGGGGDSTTTPSGSEALESGPSGPEQALSDSLQPPDMSTGPGETAPDFTDYNPLTGVSTESSTLAALNGGAAVVGGFGMVRGGFGTMPGVGTGFRLPSNWAPAGGTPFGASTASPPTAGPTRPTPNRVSAPKSRMRRRPEEEDRNGKVFAPGEQVDVPQLERPPVIGVIEYEDENELLEADLDVDFSLVGVLDRLDEEGEKDTGHSTR